MSVKIENLEQKNMVKLTIEREATELDAAINKVYHKQKNRIAVPGFRKGKAPLAMIEKMYGTEVFFEDAANEIIGVAYEEAVKESGLEIVSQPEIEVTQIEKGKPFIFIATVATKPEVELGEYKGVSVAKVDTAVSEEELNNITEKEYYFKYSSDLDQWLFMQLINYFFKDKSYKVYRIKGSGVKEFSIQMLYLDWVTLDSAYGYFKAHLNQQWRKHGLPIVNRCRTTKTKNKRRQEMQASFFSLYIIRSGIYHPSQNSSCRLSEEEIKRRTILHGVEGGKYTQQVTTGLYLE